MKNVATTIILLLFISQLFSQPLLAPAYPSEITYRGNIAYFQGYPFTGILLDEITNNRLGEFSSGRKNGEFFEYFENGNLKSQGSFNMGYKTGVHTEWFENKNKKLECEYSSGELNGRCREWYQNGNLRKDLVYANGKIANGDFKEFDENGIEEKEVSYLNNVVVQIKYPNGQLLQFHENGTKKLETNLDSTGAYHGVCIEWWPNGVKKSEANYINGNIDGKLTTWNDKSEKTSEQSYENGLRSGSSTFWEAGGIIKTRNFRNGILTSETVKDTAYLISNNQPGQNTYLFMLKPGLSGENIFVKVIVNDRTISNDRLKQQLVSTLLTDMNQRFRSINNTWHNYRNEYISYVMEISELKYESESKYDSKTSKYMYQGECKYRLKLFDNQRKQIDDKSFSIKNSDGSIFVTSYGDKDTAIRKAIEKVSLESFVYKNFPVESGITEIDKARGSRATSVKIAAGSNNGVVKKLKFKVYLAESAQNRIIAEIEVLEVFPDYSTCKVNSGHEQIFTNFNPNQKLFIVSF